MTPEELKEAREAQQPVAYYVVRHRPGKLDHGYKIGPFHSLSDAEIWVNGDHVLQPLYAAPVAPPGWVLNRSAVNEPQAESINALIARCKHAHYTNVVVRINGKDEWHEADWIKHMTAAPKEPK